MKEEMKESEEEASAVSATAVNKKKKKTGINVAIPSDIKDIKKDNIHCIEWNGNHSFFDTSIKETKNNFGRNQGNKE